VREQSVPGQLDRTLARKSSLANSERPVWATESQRQLSYTIRCRRALTRGRVGGLIYSDACSLFAPKERQSIGRWPAAFAVSCGGWCDTRDGWPSKFRELRNAKTGVRARRTWFGEHPSHGLGESLNRRLLDRRKQLVSPKSPSAIALMRARSPSGRMSARALND